MLFGALRAVHLLHNSTTQPEDRLKSPFFENLESRVSEHGKVSLKASSEHSFGYTALTVRISNTESLGGRATASLPGKSYLEASQICHSG